MVCDTKLCLNMETRTKTWCVILETQTISFGQVHDMAKTRQVNGNDMRHKKYGGFPPILCHTSLCIPPKGPPGVLSIKATAIRNL